jgi:CHAT domain-containing protein
MIMLAGLVLVLTPVQPGIRAQNTVALASTSDTSPSPQEWDALVSRVEEAVEAGDLQGAISIAQPQLRSAQASGDQTLDARFFRAVGEAYNGLASYSAALANYKKALDLDKQHDANNARYDLREIGVLYTNLGLYQEALDNLNAAFQIDDQMQDDKAKGIDLGDIGSVYANQQKTDLALQYFFQALDIKQNKSHDSRGIAIDLGNIGSIYAEKHDDKSALDYLNRALSAKRAVGDLRGEGNDTARIGDIENRAGKYADALRHYEQALSIASHLNAREDIWYACYGIQLTLQSLGRPHEAVLFGKRAVNDIQAIRHETGFAAFDAASYVEKRREVYTSLADLLISLHRLAEAQQVLRMLKEDEYQRFDLHASKDASFGTLVTYTPAEQSWANNYDQLSKNLAAEGVEFNELQQIPSGAQTDEQRARFSQLQQDIANSYKEVDRFLVELHQVYKAQSPERLAQLAARNLESLRILQAHLRKMAHGAIVVHYLVTPTRVHMLVTTPDVQIHRSYPIGEVDLNKLISQFGKYIQSPYLDPRPVGRRLYEILIQPIQPDLESAGAHTIMLSLDARLSEIPFSALYDGERWLVETYNLDVFTDAARSELNELPVANWRVAAFGVSQAWQNLSPLQSVPFELAGIVLDSRGTATTGILPGQIWLDGQFISKSFSESLAKHDFNVVHIASHFIFSSAKEDASFIILGDGSKLSVADIADGPYQFSDVDLLTLSACDTGINAEFPDGLAVEGLATKAQYMGARSVLATLWSISDGSTAIFMQSFYQLRRDKSLTKAEALRAVQLKFIRSELNGSNLPIQLQTNRYADSLMPNYQHPFFWAGFILLGNWN